MAGSAGRSTVRRSRLPALLGVFCACFAATALVMAGPMVPSAQAFQPAPSIPPSTAIRTVVSVGRWAGPVGVAIGAAYTAWEIYQNKDRIAQWWDSLWQKDAVITGQSLYRGFEPAPPDAYLTGTQSITMKCFRSAATNCATEHVGPNGASDAYVDSFARCRNPSNGTVGAWTGLTSANSIPSIWGGQSTKTLTADALCGTGGLQLVGYRVTGTHAGVASASNPFVYLNWCPVCPEASKKRKAQGFADCRKSDGTTSRVSGPYKYWTNPDGGMDGTQQVTIPNCVDGFPGSTKIKEGINEGSEDGSESQKPKWEREILPSWLDPSHPAYPCFNGTICQLGVKINGALCSRSIAACATWWENADDPKFSCHWGPVTMAITDCEVLKHHYKPNAVDDPETGVGTEPAPAPQPSAGTGGASSAPTSGANPSAPPTSPESTTDPDSQGCYGAAWSWNPVDWVMVPVKCALKWAFVPPPGTWESTFGTARTNWEASPSGQWSAAFGDTTTALAGFDDQAGGCLGPTLASDVGGISFNLKPLDACAAPMSTVASVVHGLLVVIVGFGGAFLILDPIFGSLGLGAQKQSQQGDLL